MDFTAVVTALFIALGLLGIDTFRHGDVVDLEVVSAPSLNKSDRAALDQGTLDQEFAYTLTRIAETPSLIQTPLIHTMQDEGIGMAVFAALKMKHVAKSLQAEISNPPDSVRLTLYIEQGELHGLIHGVDRRVGIFRTTLTAGKSEPMVDFVHRCSTWVAAQLAPYTTALYELQSHANDGDFSKAIELAQHAKSSIPPTPISVDRSLFDNLLGLIALFRNDPRSGRDSFEAAIAEDPTNPAPKLNAAFTDIQLGDYAQAAERIRPLADDSAAQSSIVQAVAYMTWAAAEMGQHQFASADSLLAKATALNPDCAVAFDLWAETKRAMGDANAAAAYRRQALSNSERFQNYGEFAQLYFQLAWQGGKAVTRSGYGNPASVQFH